MKILLGITFTLCAYIWSAQAGIEVGYSNVYEDTVGGATTLEYGYVPRWISGSYIRQSCGAFGETGSTQNIVNKVEHLFDCIEMGQSYRFVNGEVTFYNRYYDTAHNDIWRAYNMNMNDSRVFWQTVYSTVDYERYQAFEPIIANSGKIPNLPHVTFWQMDDKVFAHSEHPGIVQIDPHEVTNSIHYHEFDDDNFGYTHEIVLDEMAHEVEDADGTLYCSHMVFAFNPLTFTVRQWKNIFMIKDNVRSEFSRITYPDLDLRLCEDGQPYPVLAHRQGYLHSIAATENYLIIPESSYLVDICSVIINQRTYQPIFTHYFDWEQDQPTRVMVVRKSDGQLLATINTTAVFVTHQLNAYEDGDMIHADMIAFNDSSPYTHYTYVTRLLSPEEQENDVQRISINTQDWTVSRRNLVPSPVSTDFPNINPHYLGLPYTYAYMIFGIYTAAEQTIGKVNVNTGEVLEYTLPSGLFGFEPIFLPTPDSRAEDDGVIIMQGLDTLQNKGFLMIFDARDMTLIGHLTGSDLVLFGIHAKFFPADIGSMTSPTVEPTPDVSCGASELLLPMTSLVFLLVIGTVHKLITMALL